MMPRTAAEGSVNGVSPLVLSSASDPVTKHDDTPFVVRIHRRSDDAFLGTAFFITANRALGCLHYLEEKDAIRRKTGVFLKELVVKSGDKSLPARLVEHDAEHDKDKDLCLIELEPGPHEAAMPEAHLAVGMEGTTLDALFGPRTLYVVGHPGRDATHKHQAEILQKPVVQMERIDGLHPLIRDAQFPGGWTAGLSGCPLIARVDDQVIVLGIAYLGGEGHATSRALLADAILEFLDRKGLTQVRDNAVPARQLVDTVRAARRRRHLIKGGIAAACLAATVVVALTRPPPSDDVPQALAGVVWDGRAGEPMPNVAVMLPYFGLETITDDLGRFTLNVTAPVNYWVELLVQRPGYTPLRENVGLGNEHLELKLEKE